MFSVKGAQTMDAALNDTKPSLQTTTNDFHLLNQTINDFMNHKLVGDAADAKFRSEAQQLEDHGDSDAVLKMFQSSKDLPALFPNLTVDTHDGLTVTPAGGNSRDKVQFSTSGNEAFIFNDEEAAYRANEDHPTPAQETKETALADKALSVANDFFHGKLSMSATKSQIDSITAQASIDDPKAGSSYNYFEQAISKESGKYGISLDGGLGGNDFGLFAQKTSLWSSIEIVDGKSTVDSSTYNRVKDDAVWAAAGAGVGAIVGGPVGAAVGGLIGIGEGELHRYQNGLAMKTGDYDKNIFSQSWKAKLEGLLPSD